MLQWHRHSVLVSSISFRECRLDAICGLDITYAPSLRRSGIGGGGFMTVRIPPTSENASSEVWTIDFREMAPAKSNTTMYANNPNASRFGGLSIGVPGEVRGLYEAHSRWGSMPWRRLVQPSVDLAAGWPVGKELGNRLWVSDNSFANCKYTFQTLK